MKGNEKKSNILTFLDVRFYNISRTGFHPITSNLGFSLDESVNGYAKIEIAICDLWSALNLELCMQVRIHGAACSFKAP